MLTGQKGCGVPEVVHARTIVSTVGHVRGKESVIAWEDKQEEREEASTVGKQARSQCSIIML